MRYFIHLSYNGARYKGWQRQIDVISVQEVLEETLSKLFKKKISVWGCGRTDAAVHASQYYAHVDIDENWDFDICFLLKKMLPQDIVVYSIREMPAEVNAQRDACERTYDYFIHTKDDPFLCDFSSFYPDPNLNMEAMSEAVALLSKYEDYRAFCKTPKKNNHTYCTIKSAFIEKCEVTGKYHFQIVGDRFLRGMIRVIVTHLLEIGRGNETLEQFEQLFIGKKRSKSIRLACPCGLYLSKIKYPYLDEPAVSSFTGGLI